VPLLATDDALILLIPLTVPDVRRLVYRLVVRILAPPEVVLHRSCGRRLHQARAMRSRYWRRPARQVRLKDDEAV
jgi:hypothetical protein